MRTKILFITLVVFPLLGFTQTIEKFSIDSGGDSVSSGGLEVVYTIGEVMTQERNASGISVSEGFINSSFKIKIDSVVYLQGPILSPLTGGLMNDNLRIANSIPTTSPYADNATCDASVFTVTGSNAIVDWIWVELRDANDNTIVLNGASALLQRDGDVVALDGTSTLTMSAPPKAHYVAIKHRNHLGAMSSAPIQLTENITTIVDFTASSFSTFGSNAQAVLTTGDTALWAGNVNGDNSVQYSGTSPDSPDILSQVLNDPSNFLNFPTFVSTGYLTTDVNMDGNTQYTGTNPETPILLQNVLSHPGNFLNFSTYQIVEQLPQN